MKRPGVRLQAFLYVGFLVALTGVILWRAWVTLGETRRAPRSSEAVGMPVRL